MAAEAASTAIHKPTGTQREQYKIARSELNELADQLRQRRDVEVKELEKLLDKLGAPYTPGRLPGGKER